ncbi:hypothetical protein SAMN05444506_12465 [Pseudomonas syringae]|nr:hypothetical protein SAMN05444506_12465 [Pseudomonas syringae]
MPRFIINQNAQANGDHEVHDATNGCRFMPDLQNQIEVGTYPTCHGAVAAAKQKWSDNRINGCYYCANPCHTS